ncbi:MAG TPA: AI-2E family transporter [Ramlibacter sp.]|uniref:AI-2E family transporter n=1 Tax=Ramlibacter sp. TaxID=1917967 RepID=UPI002C687E4D|nr:AI-2E family transporter [Ramlibacter sp.]HVZ44996.1 AI-2E family transporter [Ramlibacter sp.]
MPNAPELEFKSLLWLVLGATLLFALVLWPFFGALCWALFIAIVFWPLHRHLKKRMGGRGSLAAAASLFTILTIVILPVVLIVAQITQEATVFVGRMRSGEFSIATWWQRALDALPQWLRGTLDNFGLADLGELQDRLLSVLGDSGHEITSRAFSIGHFTLAFVLGFFVMVYVLFFLFRDGERLAHEVARAVPLQPHHTQTLFDQFARVVRATVRGGITVAVVHGALCGLAFAVLGVPQALLWGTAMAVLALLPAVGSPMIWGPVALWFFFNGAVVKAVGLAVWCVVVVGVADNFLRPLLVGRDTRIPEWLVLVATLGGIVVFGLNGFVIGPVIAAVFLVSWDMLAETRGES